MRIEESIPFTPCYAVEENILTHNLEILRDTARMANCQIILSLKGFAMFSVFPLIRKYLSGISASSLDEAQLAFDEFGGPLHIYAPAYKDDEFKKVLEYSDHIYFNSFSQWNRFKSIILDSKPSVKCGLRINPEHSEVKVKMYDPCVQFSRLGITSDKFKDKSLEGITGLHFHTLCELGSDALERTLASVTEKFGEAICKMKWINFGGGHLITRDGYDVDRLSRVIKNFRKKFPNIKEIYLEPSAAIALNSGILVSSVLDIIHNEMDIAILDTSCACHMPDVLEMPYRPEIKGAGLAGEYKYTYRLGGVTCLAGDIIGDYSFPERLKVGSRFVFKDMAHYTMVKNNTFNGVRLPSIVLYNSENGNVRVVRKFGYEDYRNRLS